MEQQNDEEYENTNERSNLLGFEAQKENIYNKYLPYAEKLDNESKKMLKEIKENLSRAIALRDLVGISKFSRKIHRYIRLYGLKFSKQDHIQFIKLYLELITIPDLDPLLLFKLISILSILLRKSRLISPDELQIEWRPLYQLVNIFMNKTGNKGELYRYFSIDDVKSQQSSSFYSSYLMLAMDNDNGFDDTSYMDQTPEALETVLQICIQLSTPYFPESATQDILDEFLPLINPYENNKYSHPLEMMILFLNREKGFELWFDDFMNLWRVYHNSNWNAEIMSVMGVLAEKNIGKIDWEPYIPIIFSRILRSIDLPVSFKKIKCARNPNLLSLSIAQWIVSTLGPKSSTQKYLCKFIGSIETYLHPANSGKWVSSIGDIILKINKLFIDRLENERFTKKTWQKPIPDEHKLTEECITAFVECMKPIAFQAMYSQMSYMEVCKIFKNLADLRPELIVPDVIQRVYATLDSVTEPHKLTASLQCLIGISRSLISAPNGCTEYRTHVIPLLFATLPGIDPNDLKKTSVTLNFLTSFALFVPIIDCSKAGVYRDDLTEEESLICAQTAEFEDFIFQYLDKIFQLIDSSAVESIRPEQCDLDTMRSKLESVVENVIHSSVHGVLGQCSEEILCAATKKVTDRIKTSLYEPKVAGQLIGALLRVLSRVADKFTFKIMIPFIIETIQKYINDHDNIEKLDKQKDDFIYYLILLLNIVRGNPNYVLDYIDEILVIIDQVIKFECKLTIRTISTTILGLMGNISSLQTLDVRSVPDSYNKSLKEFLPIRHWGEKVKKNHKVQWYIPDENARLACEKIIYRYLIPILNNLEKHISDELPMSRDDINRDLSIIIGLLKANSFLPLWNEKQLQLIDSEFLDYQADIYLNFNDQIINMPDGTNVRLSIVNTITKLQNKILQQSEDDIKPLKSIIAIWERIHIQKYTSTPFDAQLKTFMLTKKFQDYRLTKNKADLRTVLATRVMMQHDYREECKLPIFTETTKLIMMNLFNLSISHYSNVRLYAQHRLLSMMNFYICSHRCLVDNLCDNLKLNSNDNHELFKGTLYVLGGLRSSKIIVKNDWETIEKLWIALLNTNISEKPSIVRLTDLVQETINTEFPTLTIEINIPDRCVNLALKLCENNISENEIEMAKLREKNDNKKRKEIYYNLLDKILTTVNTKSLHWRFKLMASSMIHDLVQPKCLYTPGIAHYAINNLINDSIGERRIGIRMINFIMRQQKREHIKIIVDPYKIANVKKPTGKLLPGVRDDNRWMQYDIKKVPKNQKEWDEPRYIYKINGFFQWSKQLMMYAPNEQQPKLDRDRDEMNDIEQIIFDFFMNLTNVTALVKFWSLEEKKGKDKFNRSRYIMIKHLFSTFGDMFLDNFLLHITKLIESENTDSNHRCASEILTGIMRGSKHWSYEKTEKLYTKLVPIIRKILCTISVESDIYWGTCFASSAENMDPHKQYWLHEVLKEDFFEEKLTSFIGCNRIYCMQGALAQHIWRMNNNSVELYNTIRPYLSHSFQNVRERLASLLINIFEADFKISNGSEPICPKIQHLIDDIKLKLVVLLPETPKTETTTEHGEAMSIDNVDNSNALEYDEAIRLFKTASQWVTGALNRAVSINRVEYFELMAYACRLERTESDIDLNQISNQLLAMISLGITLPDTMDAALKTMYNISLVQSWSSRIAILDVMQIMIFYNMAIVLSRDEWIEKVQEIVLRLLEDTTLEVREKAAQVLGGLIHCSFLPATDKLLEQFKRKCKTKLIRTTRNVLSGGCSIEASAEGYAITETKEACAVRQRHTGVLGLCAFISAYPYDIPDFIPDVFEQLGVHLNDPQPIPATIRKAIGNFKRTHHDNWAVHQLKFTENQLAVLSDLTVPPSYYA